MLSSQHYSHNCHSPGRSDFVHHIGHSCRKPGQIVPLQPKVIHHIWVLLSQMSFTLPLLETPFSMRCHSEGQHVAFNS